MIAEAYSVQNPYVNYITLSESYVTHRTSQNLNFVMIKGYSCINIG
jgi:hypothetical protein